MTPLAAARGPLVGTRSLPTRAWHCVCGQPLFLRNTQCLHCGRALGLDPQSLRMHALEPMPERPGWWVAADVPQPEPRRRCANFDDVGCNWLVDDDAAGLHAGLCRACRLNRTIPNLAAPDHRRLWSRIERAKRRAVLQLLELGLPVRSRLTEDPVAGVMFDFLRAGQTVDRIITGHDAGLITLDVDEADDATRERIRTALHEPYRTLLGHLRHEMGHYYWERLVRDTAWLEPFRIRFGDERQDYRQALAQHYLNGAPPDWPLRCVSAYAAMHPWEDWAETWAHYLHIVDATQTAAGFGLEPARLQMRYTAYDTGALDIADAPDGPAFLALINGWLPLSTLMNELSRSLGQLDHYPFVLSRAAVAKLHFVHRVVTQAAVASAAGAAVPAIPAAA